MGYVCGGAEQCVLTLRDGLRARGHEVKVVASDRDPEQAHFSDYECRQISTTSPVGIVRHLWSMSAYRTIRRAVREFRPDVVHFHTMGELSPSALFAMGQIPALLTIHGPEEYTKTMLAWYLDPSMFRGGVSVANLTWAGRAQYGFFRYLQRPLYKLGIRRLRLILAPSQYFARELAREHFGTRVTCVYNGVELPEASPIVNSDRLLYVGRLEHVKGVAVLLRAMAQVCEAVPGITLDIVGEGPQRAELAALAAELHLDNVRFHGWLSRDDVHRMYRECTVLVVPSVWPESFGMVVAEAMAVGRPIVGSRVGAIPELVADRENGRVVEAGRPEILAEAITWVVQGDTSALGLASRERAKQFAVDRYLATMEGAYEDLRLSLG